jgi:hypothetical protein
MTRHLILRGAHGGPGKYGEPGNYVKYNWWSCLERVKLLKLGIKMSSVIENHSVN